MKYIFNTKTARRRKGGGSTTSVNNKHGSIPAGVFVAIYFAQENVKWNGQESSNDVSRRASAYFSAAADPCETVPSSSGSPAALPTGGLSPADTALPLPPPAATVPFEVPARGSSRVRIGIAIMVTASRRQTAATAVE
jgi:hypothetical protein